MDPEVECYSRTHQVLMAIAGAGLVLYTFGYAWADFGVGRTLGWPWVEHKLVQLPSHCGCGARIHQQEAGAQRHAQNPTVR
jgi:hypothetical protein